MWSPVLCGLNPKNLDPKQLLAASSPLMRLRGVLTVFPSQMLDANAANAGTLATVIGGVVGIAVLAYVATTI